MALRTMTHDKEGIKDNLRQSLTVMLTHDEFQYITTIIPQPKTAYWQDATADDRDLQTKLVKEAL